MKISNSGYWGTLGQKDHNWGPVTLVHVIILASR